MTTPSQVPDPRPVDDRRLRQLHMAAAAVLARGEAHTPLERRWAHEVLDLTVALAEARAPAEQGGRAEPPPD